MTSRSKIAASVPSSPPSVALVNLHDLAPGTFVDIETKSRHYRIECLGGSSVRISGHPEHCPTPVEAHVQGSISKEGSLGLGIIERGSRLLIFLGGDRPITTSRVLRLHVEPPKETHPKSSASVH